MDNVLNADVFDILGPFVDASYAVLTECWLLWSRAPQVRPAPLHYVGVLPASRVGAPGYARLAWPDTGPCRCTR
jgi:hypothetical protein